MATKDILRDNLRTLMKQSPRFARLGTIQKIVAASGGKMKNGTVGRMTKGDSPTDIDKLGELAEVFGLQAWQLLVPGIKPNTVPVLADSTYLDNIREILQAHDAGQTPQEEAPQTGRKFTDKHRRDLDRASPEHTVAPKRKTKR